MRSQARQPEPKRNDPIARIKARGIGQGLHLLPFDIAIITIGYKDKQTSKSARGWAIFLNR